MLKMFLVISDRNRLREVSETIKSVIGTEDAFHSCIFPFVLDSTEPKVHWVRNSLEQMTKYLTKKIKVSKFLRTS